MFFLLLCMRFVPVVPRAPVQMFLFTEFRDGMVRSFSMWDQVTGQYQIIFLKCFFQFTLLPSMTKVFIVMSDLIFANLKGVSGVLLWFKCTFIYRSLQAHNKGQIQLEKCPWWFQASESQGLCFSTLLNWTAAGTGLWGQGQRLETQFDWPCLFEFGYLFSPAQVLPQPALNCWLIYRETPEWRSCMKRWEIGFVCG